MHIIHVNLAGGFRGGERQTELLIQALAKQGIQQTLVCRKGSPMPQHLAECPQLSIRYAAHIFSGLLHRHTGDLVHAHDGRGAHWAYWASRRNGLPYIITRRVTNPLKNNHFTRTVYLSADRVVCLSKAIAASVNSYLPQCVTSIIPSMCASLPQDPKRIEEIRARWPKRFLVGHVGALVDRHKGQRLIIEAARALLKTYPNIQFILVGEGEDRKILEREAACLPNLSLVGFQSDIGNWLGALDLFVFPSRVEGLGSSIIDAMEFGLPIVASDAGGIPDLIRHESNGLLFKKNDVSDFLEKINIIYCDFNKKNTYRLQAKKESDKYHPLEISQQYVRYYNTILP